MFDLGLLVLGLQQGFPTWDFVPLCELRISYNLYAERVHEYMRVALLYCTVFGVLYTKYTHTRGVVIHHIRCIALYRCIAVIAKMYRNVSDRICIASRGRTQTRD